MKKYLLIVIMTLFLFILIGCSINDNEQINVRSENTTISSENEENFIRTYCTENNVVIATVGQTNIKKNLVEGIKEQDSANNENAIEETVKLVAIQQFIEQNNIDVEKEQYQTFYESNSDIANSISQKALFEMQLTRDEFLEELNRLTDIIIAESVLDSFIFNYIISGDLIIDNNELYFQYLECVNEEKRFHNQEISYSEFYDKYQKFFDSYCEYIVEQSKVIYY